MSSGNRRQALAGGSGMNSHKNPALARCTAALTTTSELFLSQPSPSNLSICALEVPASASSASSQAQARPSIVCCLRTAITHAEDADTAPAERLRLGWAPLLHQGFCRGARDASLQSLSIPELMCEPPGSAHPSNTSTARLPACAAHCAGTTLALHAMQLLLTLFILHDS